MVDGIGYPGNVGYAATPGLYVFVEAGVGNFAAGDSLETDSVGRAVPHTSGVVVLRALDASSATGTIVRAVFSR